MSEIHITRFQPAAPGRDKTTSVPAVEDTSSALHTDTSADQRGSGSSSGSSSGSAQQRREQAPQTSGQRTSDTVDAAADNDAEKLEQAVSKLNQYVQSVKRDIYFDLDPLSGEPSVTVLDRESRQVLRQFDSREALELASKVDTDEPISLFKTRV